MTDPYGLADIARRVMHREAESALQWAADTIARLRAERDESDRLWPAQVARAQRAEAGAAAMRRALEGAMQLLPGGTPDDLDPASSTIVARCDKALLSGAGVQLLAVVDAARRYRDAVKAVDGVYDAEQALLAAVEAIEQEGLR